MKFLFSLLLVFGVMFSSLSSQASNCFDDSGTIEKVNLEKQQTISSVDAIMVKDQVSSTIFYANDKNVVTIKPIYSATQQDQTLVSRVVTSFKGNFISNLSIPVKLPDIKYRNGNYNVFKHFTKPNVTFYLSNYLNC